MATFLNTRKAVAQIEDLIRNAGEKLILVSPYLKLSKDFKELLTYRNNNDKITTVIFGKQELKPDEMKFLESLRFVILKFNEDLHAKCYVNEKQMIITSLNLYEFSMANNKEMGVLINSEDECDKSLYEEALSEVKYIEDTSEKFKFNINNSSELPDGLSKTHKIRTRILKNGHCIRCDAGIKFDTKVPLCKKCYKSWKKHSDDSYAERFCHRCGNEAKTSMKSPECYSCYKKK
jgi:phosphatidylserine/phosphatidylglycerophosphate/cardiolipin synthase-like enzyme